MLPEVFFDLGGTVVFNDLVLAAECSRAGFIDKLNFLIARSNSVERTVSIGGVAFTEEWKPINGRDRFRFYDDLKYFRPAVNAASILVDYDYLEF